VVTHHLTSIGFVHWMKGEWVDSWLMSRR